MVLWNKIVLKAKDIDAWRKFHMAFAEWVDAWRIIPRIVLLAYGYMTWDIITWYQELKPYMMKDCDVKTLGEACIVSAPSTEHMALVTAVIAVAAAVIGLYTGSGKKWNGFTHWNEHKQKEPPKEEQQTIKNDGE
jgi:hypothetical protein